MGVELEQRTGNLYDVVFNRKPELELWQQVFKVFPDLDRYPTRDLTYGKNILPKKTCGVMQEELMTRSSCRTARS